MDQKFKERIFGLAVLVSVGVLVYPFLTLDKPKEAKLAGLPNMPQMQENQDTSEPASGLVELGTNAGEHAQLDAQIASLQQEMDASLQKSQDSQYPSSSQAGMDTGAVAPNANEANLAAAKAQMQAQSIKLSENSHSLPSAAQSQAAQNQPVQEHQASFAVKEEVATKPVNLSEAPAPFKIEDKAHHQVASQEVSKKVEPKIQSSKKSTEVKEVTNKDNVKKETKKDVKKEALKETKKETAKNITQEKLPVQVIKAPSVATATQTVTEAALVTPAPSATPQVQMPSAKAWSVQAGSFSNEANAKAFENKLKQGGYAAYVVKSVNSNGTFVKVMVGPSVKKEDATQLKAKIEAQFAIQGLVVPYVPAG